MCRSGFGSLAVPVCLTVARLEVQLGFSFEFQAQSASDHVAAARSETQHGVSLELAAPECIRLCNGGTVGN